MFEENAVWDMRPAEIPGMGEYRGHRAIRRFFDQWLEVFPDSDVDVEDVETRMDVGLVTIVQHAVGGSSGVPAPFHYYGIGRWREGRLIIVENYLDAERARASFLRYAKDTSRSGHFSG